MPGATPASPREIAGALDRTDIHRLLAFDYLLANSDRHLQQMSVSPTGLLAYDHGHIGVRLARTGDTLVTPMHEALHAAAGLRVPVGIERSAALDTAAVASIVEGVDDTAIELAHHTTLGSSRRVRGARMQRADRFARSDQYLDGVLARLAALRQGGEIRYVNTALI